MPSSKLSQSLLPLILLLSSIEFLQVRAANDWSQPCFSGVCSYDLPDTPNGASGTLKIWGANNAIADVTTAAGWEILGCDSQSLAQDIRIVCKNPDSSGGCSKLFDSSSSGAARRAESTSASPSSSASAASASDSASLQGAVGKIVRLPQNCGKSAFARIAKAWVPADQSIPPSVARRLVRRDGETPQVHALSVDVNFGAESDTKYGPVGFAIVGANFPGAAAQGTLDTSSISVTGTPSARRSLSRIFAQRGFTDFVKNAADSISSLNNFNVDKSTDLQPFDLNQSFNLINQEIKCSVPLPVGGLNSTVGVNGQVKIDVDAKVHAVTSLGVVAAGTVIPPKVTDFGITSAMTANLDSTIKMSAGVGGSIDSGKIKLFEVGVPGLDFPGVLSIGPTFQINAQGKASLDLDVDMTVGVKWNIDQAKFTFPTGGSQGGSFTPGDTPLQITAQPSGTATGTVELHLIPSLNLGIDALDGTVGAGVFVNLDASATASLSGTATGSQQTVNVNRRALSVDNIPNIGRLGHPAAGIRGRSLIGELYFNKRFPQSFESGDAVDDGEGADSDTEDGFGDSTSDDSGFDGSDGSTVSDGSSGPDGTGTSGFDGASSVDDATDLGDSSTSDDTSDGGEANNTDTSDVGLDAGGVSDEPSDFDDSDTSSDPTATDDPDVTAADETLSASTPAPTPTAIKAIDNSSSSSSAGTDSGVSFGGCLDMKAGLSVNVGASGSFFGLFDPSTSISLFSKDFDLFKKCFGDASQAQRRSSVTLAKRGTRASAPELGRRAVDLKCNDVNVGKATSLVNDVIAAAKLL
ncbi:hypothetical protein NP233_g5127 [Leucocoprinus birnbaumii]|uniref:DUF7223 domain-containing protein n=1 Tax=Leucocoprinus birnbaumii TaxID=56174 RepID=A0AAD5VTG7_9AGAR|nr:hypothetical protein NP233_g5127 [Leucocoprinus birnbaumii]